MWLLLIVKEEVMCIYLVTLFVYSIRCEKPI